MRKFQRSANPQRLGRYQWYVCTWTRGIFNLSRNRSCKVNLPHEVLPWLVACRNHSIDVMFGVRCKIGFLHVYVRVCLRRPAPWYGCADDSIFMQDTPRSLALQLVGYLSAGEFFLLQIGFLNVLGKGMSGGESTVNLQGCLVWDAIRDD